MCNSDFLHASFNIDFQGISKRRENFVPWISSNGEKLGQSIIQYAKSFWAQ